MSEICRPEHAAKKSISHHLGAAYLTRYRWEGWQHWDLSLKAKPYSTTEYIVGYGLLSEWSIEKGLFQAWWTDSHETWPSFTPTPMSCDPLLASLKECLLHSDCVIKDGHLPSECIKEHFEELPLQCRSLRQAVFDCKRNQVISPSWLLLRFNG